MNWVDYFIIALILVSAIVSLMRGFLRELLALLVWVVAAVVAFLFHDLLAERMPWIEVQGMRTLVAFTLLFLLCMILGALLSFLISSVFEKAGISGTDRLLGGLFGAMRGALVVVLLVLLAGALPLRERPWWQESVLIGHFAAAAHYLKERLPPDVASYFPEA